MVDAVWGRLLPSYRRDRDDPRRWNLLLRIVAVDVDRAAPRHRFHHSTIGPPGEIAQYRQQKRRLGITRGADGSGAEGDIELNFSEGK